MKRLLTLLLALSLSFNAFATCELKADTAATITAGPFVDATDGVTTEEALTLTATEVLVSKNGGALAGKNDASNPAHLNAGVYDIDLSTTDTNTEGTLDIYVEDGTTDALRVWRHCLVLGADFYDLKYGTTTPITSRDVGLQYSGTISIVTSQTVLVMDGGATDDDNYIGYTACIVGGTEEDCERIDDYVGSTNTITLENALSFTVATSDVIRIHLPSFADIRAVDNSTTGAATLSDAFDGTGGVTIDADLSGSVATATALGADAITAAAIAANAIGASEIAADAIGASEIAAAAITNSELATDGSEFTEAGGTGDHLTAVPYNSAWDAEIESEVTDALVAAALDHLIVATGTCDSGTTTTCVDAARTEADDILNGVGILFPSINESSCLYDFTASSDTMTFWAVQTNINTEEYVLFVDATCKAANDETS